MNPPLSSRLVTRHSPEPSHTSSFSRSDQRATFYIQFAAGEDRLSLASAVWSDAPGIALPAWQGSEVHLYERAP